MLRAWPAALPLGASPLHAGPRPVPRRRGGAHNSYPELSEALLEYVLGIDVGGTNLVVGAVAADGSRVIGNHSQPTDATRGPDAVVADLIAMGRHTLTQLASEDAEATVLGVGIGAPGPLDRQTGVVILTPNLGWRNMPLRAHMAEGFNLPAALDNDANCAILGEAWVGAAREGRHVIGMTIGTGIGGGIVLNGRLHHGASDCAGEIGHVTIDVDGRRCGCGNYGCLEAYASGPAIARRAVEQLESGAESSLTAMVNGDLSAITAQTVYQAAAEGDELADELVSTTARYLGAGLANLINIFNPDLVVILGGVTQAGEILFLPLRREVARRAFKPAVQACTIVPGALGDLAGVYGSARAFLDQRAEGWV